MVDSPPPYTALDMYSPQVHNSYQYQTASQSVSQSPVSSLVRSQSVVIIIGSGLFQDDEKMRGECSSSKTEVFPSDSLTSSPSKQSSCRLFGTKRMLRIRDTPPRPGSRSNVGDSFARKIAVPPIFFAFAHGTYHSLSALESEMPFARADDGARRRAAQ